MCVPFLECLAACAALSPTHAAAWTRMLRDAIRTFNPPSARASAAGPSAPSSSPSSRSGGAALATPLRDLSAMNRPMAVLDTLTRSNVLLRLLAGTLAQEVAAAAAAPHQAGASLAAHSVLAPMLTLSPWPDLRVSRRPASQLARGFDLWPGNHASSSAAAEHTDFTQLVDFNVTAHARACTMQWQRRQGALLHAWLLPHASGPCMHAGGVPARQRGLRRAHGPAGEPWLP